MYIYIYIYKHITYKNYEIASVCRYIDIYRYITYDYRSKTVKHGFWISKTIYAKI